MTLRARLLAWYDQHHRSLPWRDQMTPWRVWVSEVMAQQTRIESVIPYFERFIERFPTPTALAEAELDEVLTYWAGLGYYSRARNLHAAARQVVEDHDGRVPDDPEAFQALKGVGRYTRGAVQSIAFGHPEPVVDGNVVRVLTRLEAIEADPRSAPVNRHLWARAAELVHGERPGDLNQALMELGALVCRPKSPTCLLCPLREGCQARATGTQERLPFKKRRALRPIDTFVAGLARDEHGSIWMAQRAATGLLAGLWELPALRCDPTAPASLKSLGLLVGDALAQVEHGFTHRVWRLRVHAAAGRPDGGDYAAFRAIPEDQLTTVALSGPGLKALRACGVALPHRRGAGR